MNIETTKKFEEKTCSFAGTVKRTALFHRISYLAPTILSFRQKLKHLPQTWLLHPLHTELSHDFSFLSPETIPSVDPHLNHLTLPPSVSLLFLFLNMSKGGVRYCSENSTPFTLTLNPVPFSPSARLFSFLHIYIGGIFLKMEFLF